MMRVQLYIQRMNLININFIIMIIMFIKMFMSAEKLAYTNILKNLKNLPFSSCLWLFFPLLGRSLFVFCCLLLWHQQQKCVKAQIAMARSVQQLFNLAGKTALVTGGSRGLGFNMGSFETMNNTRFALLSGLMSPLCLWYSSSPRRSRCKSHCFIAEGERLGECCFKTAGERN